MGKYISKINGYELADIKSRNKLSRLSDVAKSGDFNDLKNVPEDFGQNMTPASKNRCGGIVVGDGLTIDENHVLSASEVEIHENNTSQMTLDRYQYMTPDKACILLPEIGEDIAFKEIYVILNVQQEDMINGFSFPNIYWQKLPQLVSGVPNIFYFAYIKGTWVGSYVKFSYMTGENS